MVLVKRTWSAVRRTFYFLFKTYNVILFVIPQLCKSVEINAIVAETTSTSGKKESKLKRYSQSLVIIRIQR